MNPSPGKPKIPKILQRHPRFCEFCFKSQEYITQEANFYLNLANCGHIICSHCAAEYEEICTTCKKKVRFERINDDMPYHIRKHVQPVSDLVNKIVMVAKFQMQQTESFMQPMLAHIKTLKDELYQEVAAGRATKKTYLDLVETAKKEKSIVTEFQTELSEYSLNESSGYLSHTDSVESGNVSPPLPSSPQRLNRDESVNPANIQSTEARTATEYSSSTKNIVQNTKLTETQKLMHSISKKYRS